MNGLLLTLTIITLTNLVLGLGYSAYIWFIRRSRVRHPKPCPHPSTMKLSSINKQLCYNCNEAIDWNLKPNQAPLVSSSRDKRK